MVNAIEPFVCGGDVAGCQITLIICHTEKGVGILHFQFAVSNAVGLTFFRFYLHDTRTLFFCIAAENFATNARNLLKRRKASAKSLLTVSEVGDRL